MFKELFYNLLKVNVIDTIMIHVNTFWINHSTRKCDTYLILVFFFFSSSYLIITFGVPLHTTVMTCVLIFMNMKKNSLENHYREWRTCCMSYSQSRFNTSELHNHLKHTIMWNSVLCTQYNVSWLQHNVIVIKQT